MENFIRQESWLFCGRNFPVRFLYSWCATDQVIPRFEVGFSPLLGHKTRTLRTLDRHVGVAKLDL